MLKTFALAACTLGLATTALAQPAPPPTAPQPPQHTIRVALSIKTGADVRVYELLIADRDCGTIKEKAAQYEHDVRLCSVPTANGVAIDIDGSVRAGATEFRQRSQAIVARKGASFDVGSANGTRFTVKTL